MTTIRSTKPWNAVLRATPNLFSPLLRHHDVLAARTNGSEITALFAILDNRVS